MNEFPSSFLDYHFVRFMDNLYRTNGKVVVEDITLPARNAREAAVAYVIINDLDIEVFDRLWDEYVALRKLAPPTIPSNIELGEN